MANWYVRSGAGGSASGADWANAKLTVAAAITASAAGDDIWLSEDHSETTASGIALAFKGTKASPNRVICVNHAGSVPPVAADMTTGAIVAETGNFSNLQIQGFIYVYGISFKAGTSTDANNIVLLHSNTDCRAIYENCIFQMVGSSTSSLFDFRGGRLDFINCTLNFQNTSQSIRSGSNNGYIKYIGGTLAGAVPTSLTTYSNGLIVFDGFDFSAMTSGKTIVNESTGGNYTISLINCKLGASVTVAATPTSSNNTGVNLQSCDNGTKNYRNERYLYEGTLTTETTIIKSGGATDGTTPVSWKVVTTANNKLYFPFETFPLAVWNDTIGSSKTITVEIVNDGTTLTNADIWLDVQYMGSSATPISSTASGRTATVLTSGTNLTTSSVTWTTTGLSSPVKQYLTVSFTPQMKGYFRVVVKIAKTSKTIYVDPYLTVT